jgi:hypothetical protein
MKLLATGDRAPQHKNKFACVPWAGHGDDQPCLSHYLFFFYGHYLFFYMDALIPMR